MDLAISRPTRSPLRRLPDGWFGLPAFHPRFPPNQMQRLGKNIGGYFGDPLDLPRYFRELDQISSAHGWSQDFFLNTETLQLRALRRTLGEAARRLYISAGIHGDEPAGPLALLELIRQNQWPENLGVWICPLLNPTGFSLNKRENAQGADLNRQYHDPDQPEIKAHIQWLTKQPTFDLALCLHEDWESHGFYVYELNPDNLPSFAEKIVDYVSKVCPIDNSEVIEGRPARSGIIRPNFDLHERPLWPEAFYLFTHHTRQTYTLEAPSDFPVATRTAALVASVRAVLDSFAHP